MGRPDTVETALLIDGPCRDMILDVRGRRGVPPDMTYVDGHPYVRVDITRAHRPDGVPWEFSHLHTPSRIH